MKTEKGMFKKRLEELGYVLSNSDLERAFIAFKELREKLGCCEYIE